VDSCKSPLLPFWSLFSPQETCIFHHCCRVSHSFLADCLGLKEKRYFGLNFPTLASFCACPWLITGYIPSIAQKSQSEFTLAFIFPFVGILISVTYVAYVAMREREHQSEHTKTHTDLRTSSELNSSPAEVKSAEKKRRSQKEHLYEVMHNEHLREAFEKFMVQEFCIENVYFLGAVEEFEKEAAKPQDEASSKQLKIMAEKIYERYCNVDSKLCVNISFKARSEAQTNLNGGAEELPRADLFDQARNEVIALICEDPFRRFVRSELYTSAQATTLSSQAAVASAVEVE
jgi:hypothetical protein